MPIRKKLHLPAPTAAAMLDGFAVDFKGILSRIFAIFIRKSEFLAFYEN